jgi:hypothetical protein
VSDGRQLSREFTIFFGFWNGETVRHLKIDNTWSFEERRNSSQINGFFPQLRVFNSFVYWGVGQEDGWSSKQSRHGRTGRKKLGGQKEICPTFSDCARPVPKIIFLEEINFGDLPPPAKKISVSVPF